MTPDPKITCEECIAIILAYESTNGTGMLRSGYIHPQFGCQYIRDFDSYVALCYKNRGRRG